MINRLKFNVKVFDSDELVADNNYAYLEDAESDFDKAHSSGYEPTLTIIK